MTSACICVVGPCQPRAARPGARDVELVYALRHHGLVHCVSDLHMAASVRASCVTPRFESVDALCERSNLAHAGACAFVRRAGVVQCSLEQDLAACIRRTRAPARAARRRPQRAARAQHLEQLQLAGLGKHVPQVVPLRLLLQHGLHSKHFRQNRSPRFRSHGVRAPAR